MIGPKKAPTEDADRNGHNDAVERGCDKFQALYRAQYRDRRGEHAVAVEKCRRKDAQDRQHGGKAGVFCGA
jgi:hypothetical protein